jgi:hypothetical protein
MLICNHCGGKTGKFVEEFGVMVHERPMDCVGVYSKKRSHTWNTKSNHVITVAKNGLMMS